MDVKTRAINMITKPAAEWPVVASESHTIGTLIRGYAAPLSAIPAVCTFIGLSILSAVLPFTSVATGVVGGLIGAVLQWALGLVGLFICAVVIDLLAPQFGSTPNRVQALKLVVFAMTPIWIAGVLHLIPLLGVLTLIAAIYAIYVFYLGLPVLMRTPQAQVVPYMAVSILVIVVIVLVIGMVAGMIALMLAGAAAVVS